MPNRRGPADGDLPDRLRRLRRRAEDAEFQLAQRLVGIEEDFALLEHLELAIELRIFDFLAILIDAL